MCWRVSVFFILVIVIEKGQYVQGNCPADIALLVDRSGSICEDKRVSTCNHWESIVRFLVALVDRLPIGDSGARVALIVFDTGARVEWNLDKYPNVHSLKYALGELKYEAHHYTHTADALQLAMTDVFGTAADRSSAGNVIILVTDGIPSEGGQLRQTLPNANAAKAAGVTIVAFGVTDKVDPTLLKDISSSPNALNSNYFLTPDFNNLDAMVNSLEIPNCIRKAPPTECLADIALLVDRSGSICGDQKVTTCSAWESVVQFLTQLVTGIPIGVGGARVALIVFDSGADLYWNLDRYSTSAELVAALQQLTYDPQLETYTADAIVLASTEVFGSTGDRPFAANVIVIITDGFPNPDSQNYLALPVAQAAKDAGTQIYAFGVTNQISESFLSDISSPPSSLGKNYLKSPDFTQIPSFVGEIQRNACAAPSLNPSPSPDTVDCVVDIALLVDRSGSICGDLNVRTCDNWELMVAFLVRLFTEIPVGDGRAQVALIMFDSYVTLMWNLDRYTTTAEVTNDLGSQMYSPLHTTSTADAFDLAMREVFGTAADRADAVNIILLITDGKPYPQDQLSRTPTAAQNAKNAGVKIYAFGVTRLIDESLLRDVSSPPNIRGQNYFTSPDFNNLASFEAEIRQGTCQRNTPSPLPTPSPNCLVDIVLVVDRSGSICENKDVTSCDNWTTIVQFLVKLFENIPVGDNGAHVALVVFGTISEIVFDLASFSDSGALRAELNRLQYVPYSETYTADAINMASTQVFTKQGDRPNAPNALLLVTDGLPTEGLQRAQTPAAAQAAKNEGIKIFCFGVTRDIDENLLREMSSPPQELGRNYFTSPDFASISSVSLDITRETCGTT